MPYTTTGRGEGERSDREPESVSVVDRAQEGDVQAIGALYDQHHEGIFRYVWSRVGERHLAEDLTGEVFMRMLRALPRYRRTAAPFKAWLFRIARNLLIDHYRQQAEPLAESLETAESHVASDVGPETALDRTLHVEQLHAALKRLDPAQREVVSLRFLSALSVRETAAALNKSEAAIKALQHRGLRALGQALNQEDVTS